MDGGDAADPGGTVRAETCGRDRVAWVGRVDGMFLADVPFGRRGRRLLRQAGQQRK